MASPRFETPASAITPEALVLNRQALIGAKHQHNLRYHPERNLTAEREATTYSKFYQFGTSKNVSREAARMPLRPWRLTVGGLAGKPRDFRLDDLIRLLPIEERTYRLRCVGAGATTVPWFGFQLSELLKLVEPQAGAKFVSFETE